MNIKIVTIIGANGTMGAGVAGIIAGFGQIEKIYMLARSIDKSYEGIERACLSIYSDTIKKVFKPGTIDNNIEEAVRNSDWVIECVAEDYTIKKTINIIINSICKAKTIISTVTSSLSIEELSRSFNKDKRPFYFGTHFFNPPYKMPLCELIKHKSSDIKTYEDLGKYLENKLYRKVVETNDTPAFAGNRVAFQFLNEAALFAEKYKKRGGINYIDNILGGWTGRTMPPLITIDFIGLDIHKAIVDNIYKNSNDYKHKLFKLPSFLSYLIKLGYVGVKRNKGLYERVKGKNGGKELYFYNINTGEYESTSGLKNSFINKLKEYLSYSRYTDMIKEIANSKCEESNIIRYFISQYIAYAYSLVGKVVDCIEDIDRIMIYGYKWVPPSAWLELLGGIDGFMNILKKTTIGFGNNNYDHINHIFSLYKGYTIKKELDFRSLFIAK